MRPIDLVFNELSMETLAASRNQAREQAATFVRALREATVHGAKRALRTQAGFETALLAEDYRWVNWRNDDAVDLELRRYIRSLTYKTPYLADDPELDEAVQGQECLWNGRAAAGLSAAYALNGLSVSLPCATAWDTTRLAVEIILLDDDGELVKDTGEIIHASQPAHVKEHERRWARTADWSAEWDAADSPEAEYAVVRAQAAEIMRGGLPPQRQTPDYAHGLTATEGIFEFRLGPQFRASVRRNAKLSLELTLEACARVCLGHPKEPVRPFRVSDDPQSGQRRRVTDGALAWRTHLSSANDGFRLLFWTTTSGKIEFANVGPKRELRIETE